MLEYGQIMSRGFGPGTHRIVLEGHVHGPVQMVLDGCRIYVATPRSCDRPDNRPRGIIGFLWCDRQILIEHPSSAADQRRESNPRARRRRHHPDPAQHLRIRQCRRTRQSGALVRRERIAKNARIGSTCSLCQQLSSLIVRCRRIAPDVWTRAVDGPPGWPRSGTRKPLCSRNAKRGGNEQRKVWCQTQWQDGDPSDRDHTSETHAYAMS